jgi:hypothetical protein
MKKGISMIVDNTLFGIVSFSISLFGGISDVQFLDTIWIENLAAEGTCACVQGMKAPRIEEGMNKNCCWAQAGGKSSKNLDAPETEDVTTLGNCMWRSSKI